MRAGPRRTTGIDDALPQKKFRQAVSASHQIPASIAAGTDQITGCLLFHRRDRDLDDLVQSEQPRQMQRFQLVSTHTVLDDKDEGEARAVNASLQQIVLAQRPHGHVSVKDFRLEDVPLPELEAGGIEIETLFISVDPAIRGWLDDRPSYLPPGCGAVAVSNRAKGT